MAAGEFPTDSDFITEINELRCENDALYEQRNRLAAQVAEHKSKLRRIAKLLNELRSELPG